PDAWRESVERSSQDPVPSSPPHSHDDGINTLPHSLDPHRPTRPMAPSLREHRPAPSPDDRRGPDTLASPYVQRGAQMRPGVTYELHEDVDPGDFGPATIPVPVSVQAELPEPEGEKTAARSPAPEAIKARVSGVAIRCRTRLSDGDLSALAHVTGVSRDGGRVTLLTSSAPATLRELLARDETIDDLTVSGASLEDAVTRLVQTGAAFPQTQRQIEAA
ncbi:hypothetical protein, partial [Klebsiella sp. SWET4]|uniref:hypothetical protein n=1 Tax=Klebsiella sp. SWET4 TaxID=2961620 RepID=UPI0020C88709